MKRAKDRSMIKPFRPALTLLAQYAETHRDRRNIAVHLVGVPMIVLAVAVLLTRPGFTLGGLTLTPAWVAFAVVTLWYLTRGHLLLGAAVTALTGTLVALAHQISATAAGPWLLWGVGFFAAGSGLQRFGHYYEGRRPAAGDNLWGLLVGPMFVAMAVLARLGGVKRLLEAVEHRAGPTRIRDLAHPATH